MNGKEGCTQCNFAEGLLQIDKTCQKGTNVNDYDRSRRVILLDGNVVTESAVCASATAILRDDVFLTRTEKRAAATVLHLEEDWTIHDIRSSWLSLKAVQTW
jgi:hypothetical protein